MHVSQVSFFSDPGARRPEQLLQAWPSLVDVAQCASRAGIKVSVIQASQHSQFISRGKVNYYFLPFGNGAPTTTTTINLGNLLRTLDPDVVHVHGLDFSRDVLRLSVVAPGAPILLQDHASRPATWWRRRLSRRAFAAASGIAFCALDQAIPFQAAGLIHSRTAIYEIPESTTRFVPGDQALARQTLGLAGDPIVLWVGHLNDNKDPLTVLDGISRAARVLPRLQFYCCYGTAPLLTSVKKKIANDPLLKSRVQLLGRVPHGQVQEYMRAADVFVLGSHSEGSGYSLIEALACGLPAVVTDIASFRSLTGSGSVGALWPVGDSRSFCERLLSVMAQPQALLRQTVRSHFTQELSFEAVGRKLDRAYRELSSRAAPRVPYA